MDVYFNNDNVILLSNDLLNYDYLKHMDNNIISDCIFNDIRFNNNNLNININNDDILNKVNNIKYSLPNSIY